MMAKRFRRDGLAGHNTPPKKRPVPHGTPLCSRCGHYAFRARSVYMREMTRGVYAASVVRYLAEDEPPICNKCVGEVQRVREWKGKGAA